MQMEEQRESIARLDATFQRLDDLIVASYKKNFHSRVEVIRIEKWLVKLRAPCYVVEFMRIRCGVTLERIGTLEESLTFLRCIYAKRLLHMVRLGWLEHPFNRMPDTGPLPQLLPSYAGASPAKAQWCFVGGGDPHGHGTGGNKDNVKLERWQVRSSLSRVGFVSKSKKALGSGDTLRPATAPQQRRGGVSFADGHDEQSEIQSRQETFSKDLNEALPNAYEFADLKKKHLEATRLIERQRADLVDQQNKIAALEERQVQMGQMSEELIRQKARVAEQSAEIERQLLEVARLNDFEALNSALAEQLKQEKVHLAEARVKLQETVAALRTKDDDFASREKKLISTIEEQGAIIEKLQSQVSETGHPRVSLPISSASPSSPHSTSIQSPPDSGGRASVESLPTQDLLPRPDSGEMPVELAPSVGGRSVFQQQIDVLNELADTEGTYLRHLEAIVQQYFQPMRDGAVEMGILNEDINVIFGNIEVLFELASHFYKEISIAVNEPENSRVHVAIRVVTSVVPKLKGFAEYIGNIDLSLVKLSEIVERSQLCRSFLEDRRSEGIRPLDSLLAVPALRVTRYGLLLQRLISLLETGDDRRALEGALESVKAASARLFRSKAHVERQRNLLAIQTKMTGCPFKLVAPHRTLIREGSMRLASPGDDPEDVHMFLFNDLLVTAIARGSTHKYRSMPSQDEEQEFGTSAFALSGAMDSSILMISSPHGPVDTASWSHDISDFIDGLRGPIPQSWSLSRSG